MTEDQEPANVIDFAKAKARREAQVLPKGLTKEEARNLLGILESLMDDDEDYWKNIERANGLNPDDDGPGAA